MIKAKKALGQNFLTDSAAVEKIIEISGAGPGDTVVEIGPGPGTLTVGLAERAQRVIAVELDGDLIPVLRANTLTLGNVEIVNEDILKFDWNTAGSGRIKVVGNLPYYITTPILLGLFEKNVPADSITVMVQKEVAERITADPGGRDFGVLSLSMQYYCGCEYMLDVPAESFTPAPKVDSAVIRLTPKAERLLSGKEEERFFKIIKQAFSQRRKTLANTLAGYAGYTKEELCTVLSGIGIEPSRRPETLGLCEFADLTRALGESVRRDIKS